MCATDRSQNTVCSQTVSIQYLIEMLNISSSPSFIRNSLGELVHTSPLFDKLFFTNNDRNSWFSSISVDVGVELVKSEISALTGGTACLVQNVQINDQCWSVFIECVSLKDELFSKWVFIQDGSVLNDRSGKYAAIVPKINQYLEKRCRDSNSDWAVFNLYAIGCSHSIISKIIGVEEQTSKNVVNKIKKDIKFSDRDHLILSSLYSSNYSRIVHNVMDILRSGVNNLLF